jgi:hypothetical protein
MDDTSGQLRVTLASNGGHVLDLDDNGKAVSLESSGGHSISLSDQGKKLAVKTTSGNEVTLDDDGSKITVQTKSGVSIVLDATSIKLTATSSVSINANSIKLGGDSATQSLVLGEALMAAYNAHTHNCTAPGAPSGVSTDEASENAPVPTAFTAATRNS